MTQKQDRFRNTNSDPVTDQGLMQRTVNYIDDLLA